MKSLIIGGYDIGGIIECIVYVFTITMCVGYALGFGAWLSWKTVGLL